MRGDGIIYRFGEFEFDGERLDSPEGPIELQPRPLALLSHLLRHRDRIVSKQELLDSVWEGVVVSDTALSSALKDLRRGLGDTGSSQSWIETRRGRGYRFVGEVGVRERGWTSCDGEEADERPFVGRVEPLRRLDQALGRACAGRGGALFLCGEAGIGKTRLAEVAALMARERGAEVVRTWCHEGAGVPPYWIFVQVLRGLSERWPPARLAAALGPRAWRLEALLPGIAPAGLARPPESSEPEVARFRLFEALSSALTYCAEQAPILLVLEDLHWADVDSLRMLDLELQRLRSAPILVLATCRDDEIDALHPLARTLGEVARHDWCARLELPGLSVEEVGELLRRLTGAAPTPAAVAQILEKTDGNPLFVNEWGSLVRERARGAEPDFESLTDEVPPGIRNLIRARLAGLPRRAVAALEAASVVGREFGLDLLNHVTGDESAAIAAVIDDARRCGLTGPLRNGSSVFSHALVQETLYEQQDAVQRGETHYRVARALERSRGADLSGYLAEIATHHARAVQAGRGEPQAAVDYARRAAEHARGALALAAADAYYGLAIELLDHLVEPDEALRFDLLLARGETRAWTDRAASGEILEHAEEVARRLDDPVRFGRAVLEHSWGVAAYDPNPPMQERIREALGRLGTSAPEIRVDLLRCLAGLVYIDRRLDEASTLVDEGLALARRLDDDARLARLELTQLLQQAPRRDPAEVLEQADRKLFERLEPHPMAGRIFELRLRCMMALGLMKEADHEAEDLAHYVNVQHSVRGEMFLLWYRLSRELLEGRAENAERLALEARPIAERHVGARTSLVTHFGQLFLIRRHQGRLLELEGAARRFAETQGEATSSLLLALVLSEHGELREAREHLDYMLARSDPRRLPANDLRMAGYVWLGDVAAAVRHEEGCRTLYELLLPFAHTNPLLGYALLMWDPVAQVLGRLASALEMWSEAELHFGAALERIRKMGCPALAPRAQLDYAAMLEARAAPRDADRVIELAQEALGGAEDLGMEWIAKQAAALLARH